MSNQSNPQFLKNTKTGRVLPFHPLLARNKNMVPFLGSEDEVYEKPPAPRINPEDVPNDYESMSWQALKRLVEMKGGTYSARNDAIAFLQQADEESA